MNDHRRELSGTELEDALNRLRDSATEWADTFRSFIDLEASALGVPSRMVPEVIRDASAPLSKLSKEDMREIEFERRMEAAFGIER
ncbi:hypothetical protein [Adlercreutzia equolifaciens]|uniref:hypothetical protein n=1 Tax=Adlercreutzia equolifaciens TaxID=446660 RepID=UPI00241D6A81|nr:hypothetical protein [Adlercreutzia equolifaciens]